MSRAIQIKYLIKLLGQNVMFYEAIGVTSIGLHFICMFIFKCFLLLLKETIPPTFTDSEASSRILHIQQSLLHFFFPEGFSMLICDLCQMHLKQF